MMYFKQALSLFGDSVPSTVDLQGNWSTQLNQQRTAMFVALPEEEGDQQFYGMEMELPFGRASNQHIQGNLYTMASHVYPFGSAYLDAGIEVVTCPATYGAQMEIVKRFFERSGVGTQIKLLPFEGSGNHIHISTAPLDAERTLTVWEIIHTTEPPVQELVTRIAQREHLGRYFNGPAHKKFVKEIIEICKGYNLTNENYSEIYAKLSKQGLAHKNKGYHPCVGRGAGMGMFRDMGSTGSTHEIRIFRAPVCFKDAAKNLEFMRSCIDFSSKETDVKAFPSWLIAQGETYPHLHAFLRAEQ